MEEDLSKDEYVLIKDSEAPLELGYIVAFKNHRSKLLWLDNPKPMIDAVDSLLAGGATIYNSWEEYCAEVKELKAEEAAYRNLEFWEKKVPKEKWPEEVKQLIDKKNKR